MAEHDMILKKLYNLQKKINEISNPAQAKPRHVIVLKSRLESSSTAKRDIGGIC
jgi:hypothetical protein